MPGNDKPRISLSDMQARLASNREMLQKNCSPTKSPSKSYLRRQQNLQANAKFEGEVPKLMLRPMLKFLRIQKLQK